MLEIGKMHFGKGTPGEEDTVLLRSMEKNGSVKSVVRGNKASFERWIGVQRVEESIQLGQGFRNLTTKTFWV